MCRQEMNQRYIVREQDRDSTPVCDGFSESCQIAFLFFRRMWNVYTTSSTGCGGESTLWCRSHHVWYFHTVATESIPVGFCAFNTLKEKNYLVHAKQRTPSELVVITRLHQAKMLTFNDIVRCIYIPPILAFWNGLIAMKQSLHPHLQDKYCNNLF